MSCYIFLGSGAEPPDCCTMLT